jgi:hypothetical protein
METRAWLVTIAGALLLACSSNTGSAGFNSAGGDNGSSSGASSGGGSGSSGGTASSGGSSGGSSSGMVLGSSSGTSSGGSGSSSGGRDGGGPSNTDAGIATGDIGKTVTLTAGSFQVAPGAEVYKCQVFANPFGADVDLLRMHGVMSSGSHHFFLFNLSAAEAAVQPPVGTLGDCTGKGIEFHPFPFLSQQPDWTVVFPKAADGSPMGYPFPAANSFMINVHYLNTGSTPISPTVTITVDAAKPGIVKTHVGTIFLNQNPMNVPVTPMSAPMTFTKSWGGNPGAASADGSYSIFSSWSHMHKWALDFQASTNSTVFYDEKNWDSPGLFWHVPGFTNPPTTTTTGASSPVHMTSSQGISWSCKYYNDTGATLTFGDSALTNVMCIYLGQYYPASATAPDVIYVVN